MMVSLGVLRLAALVSHLVCLLLHVSSHILLSPSASPPSASPTPAVVRPTPLHALVCPYVDPSTAGICTLMCSYDSDCEGDDEMCCSNGCGRVCMNPDRVPYYTIPLDCPSNSTLDLVGTCDISQRPCTESSACPDNQLCCLSGGCGRYCTYAVASSQPCFAVRQLFTTALGGIPGAFIPTCQDDGSFSASQFHGSTGLSWCVDVRTGYPVSPFYPRGSTPNCPSEQCSIFEFTEL